MTLEECKHIPAREHTTLDTRGHPYREVVVNHYCPLCGEELTDLSKRLRPAAGPVAFTV